MGALTTVGPTHYMMRPLEPRWAMYSLAFLFANGPHIERFVDESDIGKDVMMAMERFGIKVPLIRPGGMNPRGHEGEVPGSYTPYVSFPIRTMEDLEGKRIRCMTTPGQIRMGIALGFNAQAITFQEAGMALQTGMLDGLITCPNYKAYMVPIGVLEHLDYCMWWPPTQVGISCDIINLDWWNQFPEAMQEELTESLEEYMWYRIDNIDWIYRHETGEIIKNEMQNTRLTVDEFQRWRDACREPIWDWWAADIEGGAEVIAAAEAMTPDLDAYCALIDAYLGDSLIWPE